MNYALAACALASLACLTVRGQEQKADFGELHGNFQADAQYYVRDEAIDSTGQFYPEEKFLLAGFANLTYTRGNFSAGLRYENYQNNLLGLPQGFKGEGIPYRWARFANDWIDITVGNFYDQFGNGFTFRAFEERGLGWDNSVDGLRIKMNPTAGVFLKGIIGRQRLYFGKGEGIVRGIDAELHLNEIFGGSWHTSKHHFIVGGSFVSKFQPANDPFLNLPQNVSNAGARIQYNGGGFALQVEGAYKINDPSADNFYIFKSGNAVMVSASYATKGLGILASAKRIDNMSFRSDRNATLTDLQINYLPPTTKLHTYALPALYPYATQPNGEMGTQLELTYTFPRGSWLGGKYGTTLTANHSIAYSIDRQPLDDSTAIFTPGTQGYTSKFFKVGDYRYFQDINVELKKKFNKQWKVTLSYFNIEYNFNVINNGIWDDTDKMVYLNAGVAEIQWDITPKRSLRTEFQVLLTDQDRGDWAFFLAEFTFAPHWFVAFIDAYNYGNPVEKNQIHYPSVTTGYRSGPTSIQLGYGRRPQGVFCVGGICRIVPPTNGLTILITSNF
jgi:hypothetical protein